VALDLDLDLDAAALRALRHYGDAGLLPPTRVGADGYRYCGAGAGGEKVGFMRIATERLTIAPLALEDAAAFAAYRQRPEIARYQSWETSYSLADASALVEAQAGWLLPPEGDWMQLGVHAENALVGDVAIHLLDDQPDTWELGVTFAEQGNGFATEALGAVVEHLFERHGAHRVLAFCDARNTAVHALLERVGLRQESRQVRADWFKGEWTTLDGFAMLASEWNRA
jgi:RimJ/RimL family protein N-acetyltransferase